MTDDEKIAIIIKGIYNVIRVNKEFHNKSVPIDDMIEIACKKVLATLKKE